jgi:hypothetical protein
MIANNIVRNLLGAPVAKSNYRLLFAARGYIAGYRIFPILD